ncbi:MAG: hypothetical protein WD059_15160 [Balneolaceae bacterium]
MGSTGSGRLSDYSGKKSTDSSGKDGGASGEDKCGKAFSTHLEDVGTSKFYEQNDSVPSSGESVSLSFKKRIIAVLDDGTAIGNLPTAYNYLKFCMDDGFNY